MQRCGKSLMEGRCTVLLILLVLQIDLSEASYRGTGKSIETRKRGVVRTLKAITLWLLMSAWTVAALSMVAVDALTLFHVSFSIVMEPLLFHESGKSVDGASCVFKCVS